MKTHCLIGKTITDIQIARDKEAILFVCGDEQIIARADADCCSHTWVENIDLPALGFPATVIEANDIALNENLDDRDGELQYYGFCIKTDRGEILIDYRNESNGYYGGWLSWPEDHFYGGVYGQNVSKEEWEPVAQ